MGEVEVAPLTPDRWPDLERLFGTRGAYGGCWCMYWRLTGREWEAGRGARNRAAFEAIVRAGPPPGLLAHRDGEPVGWVAVAPRPVFGRILRSPTIGVAPQPEGEVWSLNCFYVARGARRSGVARALVAGAVEAAREAGVAAVEAYPHVDAADATDDVLYTGLPAMFAALGFREVAAHGALTVHQLRL